MGIFDRMGKVISSNVNALLDKADDPKKNVDLLIEEMRDQIKKGRQEVVSAMAAEKQLKQKLAEVDAQIDKWQHRAELAVKAGDEPLAREALLHKKRLVADRDKAEAMRGEQRGIALKMKDDMERCEAKLKELEARKGTIVAQYEQARAGGGSEALGAKGTGPTPFEEMRRIEDKMDRAQAEAEGMKEAREVLEGRAEGGMSQEDLEAKFAALEGKADGGKGGGGDSDVEDELKSLRKKFRIGS
jgi:phage shock protein A